VQLLQAQGAKPVPKILPLQAAKHFDPIRHTILQSLHFSTIVFYKNRSGKSIYKTHKIGNAVRQWRAERPEGERKGRRRVPADREKRRPMRLEKAEWLC